MRERGGWGGGGRRERERETDRQTDRDRENQQHFTAGVYLKRAISEANSSQTFGETMSAACRDVIHSACYSSL